MDDAEKLLNEFKPVTYDVTFLVKAIEAFEAKAVGVSVSCLVSQFSKEAHQLEDLTVSLA